ncbi:MAG: PAS domain-containing sensor histidine kinase [Planctomycetes bacterium]|nr:PAS domain-containing sensor histidine kinase [Planctomycetota bacterium]
MKDKQAIRTVEAELRERVKELSCLYNISQLASRPNMSLGAVLQEVVNILPLAWQYPDITRAVLVLDRVKYVTEGMKSEDIAGFEKLSATIVVYGVCRGSIEVDYQESRGESDIGPFLKEEQYLIYAVARHVELIIENKQVEEDKTKLEDQIRHADRLATIGMLAAGVAHELNEPLGNILGFSQLVKKSAGLSGLVLDDIIKIEQASLYARSIIQKLLVFSRQKPPQKSRVNLNQVVEGGMFFLEARCGKESIEVVRQLEENLPEITADPSQIQQLLVNMVVNAIQAMPEGGRITLRTESVETGIKLVVEDTGMGMSEEVVENIFLPFFTTKEVGSGTGLGLAVVHGIVEAHGGRIQVDSKPNFGSRFEVILPLEFSENPKE